MATQDQVIALGGAYWAMVEGHLYGPWEQKEIAQAGLETEQRRAAKRKLKQK